MGTRTGNFRIGFRRGWSSWQKDDLKALASWAKEQGFDAIDLGYTTAEDIQILNAASLDIGTADLPDVGNLLSTHADDRAKAITKNIDYIRTVAAAGGKTFFTIVPGHKERSRKDNYAVAVESFSPIAATAAEVGANIVIEGWPGGGDLGNLCCTPETYRSFIKDLGGKGIGVNFDPSHLIRMGVDHIRFVKEFAPYVYHVHGKDTEIDSEAIYEFGLYQSSAFSKGHGFGEFVWRYTIPGHGQTRWSEAFRILKDNGFSGAVCVELEDENYNTGEEGEKAGLLASLAYLRTV